MAKHVTDDFMPLRLKIWRSGTAFMMPEARGPYLDLILAYWELGPLPNDDAVLQSNARVADPKLWRRIRQQIIDKFKEKDGILTHERCDLERAIAAGLYEKKSNAGQAGGKASGEARRKRSGSKNEADVERLLEANDQANGNTKDRGQRTENKDSKIILSDLSRSLSGKRSEWSTEQKRAAWQSNILVWVQRSKPEAEYLKFYEGLLNDEEWAAKKANEYDGLMRAEKVE